MIKQNITQFVTDKEEWLKAQNDALNYLQMKEKEAGKTKTKVTQAEIIGLAKNAYIEMKKDEVFRLNIANPKILPFVPVVSDVKCTVEELNFTFTTYFIDNFSDFKIDFQPEAKFEYDSNYETKIAEFQKSFLSAYTFYLDSQNPVQEKDMVELEGSYKDVTGKAQEGKVSVLADSKSNVIHAQKVLNHKVGDVLSYEQDGNEISLKITAIKSPKVMPITDENVSLMGFEKFKTQQDVLNEVKETVLHQIFSDELFKYGQKLITEILRKNDPIKIPEVVITQALAETSNGEKPTKELIERTENMISQYFWMSLISKTLDIQPTETEMEAEKKLVQQFLGQMDDRNLDLGRIGYMIISKKLALYFLNKYEADKFQFVTNLVPHFW
ncbi:trigger factor-related chaperone [Mycoplasma buteonis]|uniref:trigger factor-related chaperone n=1 Tax=Mycoplasma buteonis TaxID=171280 RepID=UPI0005642DEA|nr:hypothetical protein [Mycoplasma buteonis]